ncbi:MAG: ZIP family metal transporter [Methanocellales archaeon]
MSIENYILISIFIVSLISLIGIFTFARAFEKMIFALIAFAAGSLLGAAFFDLLPEAMEEGSDIFEYVLAGMLFFFILERFIFWRHCHDGKCDVHAFTYLNLIGDSIHNYIDGMIIAASYIASIPIGITATLAIIFHEIPQEIGDYGILIYGGFSKRKALLYNFIISLAAFLGATFVMFFPVAFFSIGDIIPFLLSFGAGGFIYIASADLIPELHKVIDKKKSSIQIISLFLGIAIIWIASMFLQ